MASKTLKESIELLQIARKLVPKKASRISDKGKNQESLVYRQISKLGPTLSDEAIIHTHRLTRRRYQQILSEIKSWLFERIAEYELPENLFSNYACRLFSLDRAHATLRILQRLGANYTANEEARYWFEEAKILEEWRLAISLLSPLQEWAMLSGDDEEYERLSSENERLLLLESALRDATDVSRRATMVFAKSGEEHPELLSIILPAIERLRPIALEYGSFRLNESMLLLRRMAQQVATDYEDALAICTEMDTLLDQYPLFANRARKSRNALAKLLCFVQRKRYEDARVLAESSLELFDTGDQNWHSFQSWRFLLFMHTKQFAAALELLQTVMGTTLFPTQTEATRDLWKLFRGYAEFMAGQPVSGAKFRKNEKAGELHRRLMREFPSFKGDYAGYEMAAIVLEILVLLGESIGDLYLRTESLQKYKSRHLKPGEETQSDIFIELVQLLEIYDLDRSKILEMAAPLVKRMVAIKTIDRLQTMQVLPYELLWSKIEERLAVNA